MSAPGHTLPIPLDLAPMEARTEDKLPAGDGWQFEPKWDGFRCLAFRDGPEITLKAKSGKDLERFFPEVVELLRAGPERFVLDGELVIRTTAQSSFSALQARLHPAASRIARLSRETPAELMAFDCLLAGAGPLLAEPLSARRAALVPLVAAFPRGVHLTPALPLSDAERLLASGDPAVDGIVAKRLDRPYEPGERAMVKVKRLRTADCVVGGFRYQTGARLVGSLLLGLYDDDGKLNHVGFTSALSDAERPALTAQLEACRGPSAFTGTAPGGPSRWATARSSEWQPLRPELVVEVRFDQVTDGRFRHGVALLRWRPDKSPLQCRSEQIK